MVDDQSELRSLLEGCASGDSARGQTAAFALVTAYDHDISELEVGRFVEYMLDRSERSPAKLAEGFSHLAEAMKKDLDGATHFVTGLLTPLRHDPTLIEEVVRAARVAAVADTELQPREEVALKVIGEALGTEFGLI